MRRILVTVAAAMLSTAAFGATVLIDGDTIAVDGERIRIINIDTPETWKPRCENELKLGLESKQRLRELLDQVSAERPLVIVREKHDYWRRTLAYVLVGETDVGEAMIASGHALPWSSSKASKARRLAQWCPNG